MVARRGSLLKVRDCISVLRVQLGIEEVKINDGWMDGWMDGDWMDAGWMESWVDVCRVGWVDGWMDAGWIGG